MDNAEQRGNDGANNSSQDSFGLLASRFEALRKLPAAQREQALATLEREDPGLTTMLRRLFAQHSDDPDELAAPDKAFAAEELASAAAQLREPLPMPAAIGPYRPLRELGRGGMGTVYLAERQGGDFTQTVAVKVLRAAPDDLDLQHRFRTERRILAGLQHKNIAAMFDGGTTEDGQPYVVMEYVDGTDLLRHCRDHDLDVAGRLRLFVEVCRAVAHAHRALVVHRDLKPGNILVAQDGQPKLLDFGIAKLLHDEQGAATAPPVTRTGNMLLTPEYSSPEQVRGEAITTATDVYALGAILYELLSGHRAQVLPDRSLPTILSVVCEQHPPSPSTRIDATGTALRRRLRGDLDNIVACAMRKEPERRYHSAAALADDLQRHLDGLPVSARADTFAYRSSKFVRRHRLPLAGTALLLAMLIAFVVTTASQNRVIRTERNTAEARRTEAEKQRDIAEQQRAEAEQQRAIATQIAEFLVDLFAMASPDPERAEAMRARELLDRGARRIDLELDAAPAQRAALQLAMGRAYVALGLYAAARPLLDGAEQAFAASQPGGDDHRTAQYWCGVLSMHAGNEADGNRLLRSSLEPLGNGAPHDPRVEALRCATIASWLRDTGRFDEAEQFLDRAERVTAGHRIAGLSLDAGDLRLARAAILRDRGDFQGSLQLLRLVELEAEASGEPQHPRYLVLYRELGRTFKELGNLQDARSAFELSLQQSRDYAGEAHPDVDTALFSLAQLEVDLGDLQRGEHLLRECLLRDEDRFGAHHAYPALVKAQLAAVLGNLDRADEAEAMFVDALAIQRDVLPQDHPELATTIGNFGTFLHRERRFDAAAPLFAEALARRQKLYAPDHPAVLTSRNQVAVLELERGNAAAAEVEFRLVLDARRQVLGQHEEVAGSLLSLATAIARQGREEEAVPLFEESIAMFAATLPQNHPTHARPRLGLGLALIKLQRAADARTPLHKAVAIHRAAFGDHHAMTYYSEYWLAQSLSLSGDDAAAIELLRPALQRASTTHPGAGSEPRMRELLAVLLERNGDKDGAAALRK